MIDVMAQTSRCKPNANSLKNHFVAEGEQHYWLHIAIDRFTGQVIDKQIEAVNEQGVEIVDGSSFAEAPADR